MLRISFELVRKPGGRLCQKADIRARRHKGGPQVEVVLRRFDIAGQDACGQNAA